MQWVGYDVQARQRYLAMLLSYIRLPLLPPQVWKFTQVTHSSKLPLDINPFFFLSNFILFRGFLLTGVYGTCLTEGLIQSSINTIYDAERNRKKAIDHP